MLGMPLNAEHHRSPNLITRHWVQGHHSISWAHPEFIVVLVYARDKLAKNMKKNREPNTSTPILGGLVKPLKLLCDSRVGCVKKGACTLPKTLGCSDGFPRTQIQSRHQARGRERIYFASSPLVGATSSRPMSRLSRENKKTTPEIRRC